jgi:hypothetical protein
MKVNGRELTDDEMDRRLGRQYRRLTAHHLNGECDHPGTIPVGQLHKVLRDCVNKVAAAQDAPDESEISPVPLGADSAPRGGISMSEAFKGFDRVGLKFPMPPRK